MKRVPGKTGYSASRVVVGMAMLAIVLLAAACVPGPNAQANVPNEDGNLGGFWDGLWQGVIAPITFIVSLFNHNVAMYEVHNNGGWYNLGYLLGLAIILGGSGGGASRRRRRRSD